MKFWTKSKILCNSCIDILDCICENYSECVRAHFNEYQVALLPSGNWLKGETCLNNPTCIRQEISCVECFRFFSEHEAAKNDNKKVYTKKQLEFLSWLNNFYFPKSLSKEIIKKYKMGN